MIIFGRKKSGRSPSEGEAEGGVGGIPPRPSRSRNPAALLAPLESLQCKLSNGARSEQNPAKKFFFLLPARIATQSVAGGEEKIGARKLKNVKKTFLRGGERQRAAAGRSEWIFSGIFDKMSSSRVV